MSTNDPSSASNWVDACAQRLAGEAEQPPRSAGDRAIDDVRRIISARHEQDSAADQMQEDRLIARWRAEGLLDGGAAQSAPDQPRPWWRRAPWRRGIQWGLPAAAMLVLVLLLLPRHTLDSPIDDGPVMRGIEEAQRIPRADAKAYADRVEQLLRAGGVPMRRIDLGRDRSRIQAQVADAPAAVRDELRALGVTWPESGRLDILIEPPRPAH